MLSFLNFKKKPKAALGIDIGTSGIRIVELAREGEQKILKNYAELKINSNDKNDVSLSPENVSKAISFLLEESKIKTREANFSIPDFSSFATSFKLPPLTESEIPEAVDYTARSFVPMPLSELVLDWTVTKGELSKEIKKPVDILLVAIPKKIISQYRNMAEGAGLEPKMLEAEVFSLARAAEKKNPETTSLLMDIGERSTTISILEAGILKLSHSFNISGETMTKSLASSLGLRKEEAEQMKRKFGLSQDSQGQAETFKKVLKNEANILTIEAKKITKEYFQKEGRQPEKIYLSGSGSKLPGLKEFFAETFGKQVFFIKPFENISYPAELEPEMEELGLSFGIAAGLALKSFE